MPRPFCLKRGLAALSKARTPATTQTKALHISNEYLTGCMSTVAEHYSGHSPLHSSREGETACLDQGADADTYVR
jgi:hypothetical protein